MSESGESTAEMLERALDAHDPAAQRALQTWIATRPADEQAHWNSLLAEVRQARAAISDVPVPLNLEAQLCRIAAAPATPRWQWRDLANYQLNRLQMALVLVAAMLLLAFEFWPQQPQRPPVLNGQVAQQISTFGVNHRSSELAIATDDSSKVLALFGSRSLGFEPKIPRPVITMTLLGGGFADFGTQTAVFTRWHGGDGDRTLFQFNARPFNMPRGFDAWSEKSTSEVAIWPGADGTAWMCVGPNCNGPMLPFSDCE